MTGFVQQRLLTYPDVKDELEMTTSVLKLLKDNKVPEAMQLLVMYQHSLHMRSRPQLVDYDQRLEGVSQR